MSNQTDLHRAVDADWKAALDRLIEAEPWNIWAQFALLNLWRDEKMYIDRYEQRYPIITNIRR